MFLKIYELIKKYDNIVIARHIGVDPDAMSSSFALKNSILLTFPNKHVRLAGTGSNRFSYFGKLDKAEDVRENSLSLFLISSASIGSIPFLSFFVPIFA